MLWIAIETGCNEIFQKLTRTISYFGMTIGDNTGRILDVPRLVDDNGPPQRVTGNKELTGIGFRLFLTLPDVLFNISGWKRDDLLGQLRTIARCTSKFQLRLEVLYIIVGRLLWVRTNSYLYMPHFGVLHSTLIKMLATRSKHWTIAKHGQVWLECVVMLDFFEKQWTLVMPSIVRPWRKFAAYTDATRRILISNLCQERIEINKMYDHA